MHINNKSTNGTTLNFTIKLHAQYKITVWTTCTYKSHTDTWKCQKFNDSSSTYRIEVWWGVTSDRGRLIVVDRTAPASVTWRCWCLTLLERCLLCPWVPGSSGNGQRNVLEMSRLLQNARRLVQKSIVCWRWWRWLLYCREFVHFHEKRHYQIDLWTYRL